MMGLAVGFGRSAALVIGVKKFEAQMKAQSILYRTLLLFGGTLLAVAVMFALLIWWIVRRGGKPARV